MSREELLEQLDREFNALLASIEGLSDEQFVKPWYGAWSAHDIIAHITGWHHEMDDALERIARGERPAPEGVDYGEADAWNARFVETWAGTSPAALVAELKASKDLFVSAAREVPEDRFEEGRAAYRILHGTAIDHYQEHAPAIREWRRKEGI